jgi:hypothetical protein
MTGNEADLFIVFAPFSKGLAMKISHYDEKWAVE